MKAIAILLLASLPVPQVQAPRDSQVQPRFAEKAQKSSRKGGTWYFARTGHAVYCYGPVMTLSEPNGEIQHVATFCRGNKLMVPLKD